LADEDSDLFKSRGKKGGHFDKFTFSLITTFKIFGMKHPKDKKMQVCSSSHLIFTEVPTLTFLA